MISRDEIQSFVKMVAQRFHPAKVILFGSYSYGNTMPDSDVDVMVVMPHRGSSVKVATRIRLACPRSFPMDLLVRSPAEIRRRIQIGDTFVREIISKGVVLHDADHAGMD